MLIIVLHTLPQLSYITDCDWLSVTYIYHFFFTTYSLPHKIIFINCIKVYDNNIIGIQISISNNLLNKEIFLLLFSCGISYTPKIALGLIIDHISLLWHTLTLKDKSQSHNRPHQSSLTLQSLTLGLIIDHISLLWHPLK